MTGAQRFLQWFLPAFLFDTLRRGTRNYILECPCGHKRDLWDSGGIKGAGTEESTYKKCPQCEEWHWQKKRRKTTEELLLFPAGTIAKASGDGLMFRSRSDWWALCLVWGSALLFWISGTVVLCLYTDKAEGLIGLLLSIPGGLIAPWFWMTTSYHLTETDLTMRSGCFSKRLPLTRIRSIHPKRGGIGINYAFSLDTLEIKTEGTRLCYRVSPIDTVMFLSAMDERCPHLQLSGGKLVSLGQST